MEKNNANLTTVVTTGLVRLSYQNLFEPRSYNGGDEKYGCTLIIPKDDEETIAKIDDAIEAACAVGIAKFGGKVPNNLKIPLRDGDDERADDEAFQNAYFINANSINRPKVVDVDLNPIMDKEEVYSGCYVLAQLGFYAYNAVGNKGIACAVNNVMKVKDGERLAGGGQTPEQAFGNVDVSKYVSRQPQSDVSTRASQRQSTGGYTRRTPANRGSRASNGSNEDVL